MAEAAVVDASVALKWVLPEERRDELSRLEPLRLVAPDYLVLECANGIWAQVLKRTMDLISARAALADARRLPIRLIAAYNLYGEAFELSLRLRHAIYDCLYLALAIDLDIPLITADEKFALAAWRHADLRRRVQVLGATA